MLTSRSSSCVCLSDLETSRGEPGSRVLVQADNSFSARRRPVLWADIQDVVHCLLWGTTFTDRGVLEDPLQHGRAEPAYTRAKAVEGCPLLSRQVEARHAVWIADEVVQSRRRSCQPIVFPAGPEPGLLRHAWGRQIAEMMGLWEKGRRDFKRARVGLSWSILWRRWSSFAWALRDSARTAASRRKVGGAMPERMVKWLTGVARRHPETVRMALLITVSSFLVWELRHQYGAQYSAAE